jgi:hypothetical protein
MANNVIIKKTKSMTNIILNNSADIVILCEVKANNSVSEEEKTDNDVDIITTPNTTQTSSFNSFNKFS